MKLFFCGILSFISFLSFSQDKETQYDNVLFEKTEILKDSINNIYDLEYPLSITNKVKIHRINENILTIFDILISKFPDTKHLPDILFNKGQIELEFNYVKKAKESLIIFIELQKESSYNKNRAYKSLAWIEIEEKNFKQAMLYLKEEENIKLFYDCGNFYESDKAQLKNMYSICEKGLVELEKNKN